MGQESWSDEELEKRLQQLKTLKYTAVAVPMSVKPFSPIRVDGDTAGRKAFGGAKTFENADVAAITVRFREKAAKMGFEVIEAAYEYAFVTSDRAEIAGSVGLHYTTLEARLAATVTSPTTGTRSIGGPRSVDAPLPVVGLRGMWRIGDQVYLDAQAQYFSLAIDDIKGSLYNYRAALIWQPTRRVGIGAGYDAFGVDVELRQDDFRGKVDWVYRGPQVFVTVAF
jgi:hypothetical protein